jgi:hypothetical protein
VREVQAGEAADTFPDAAAREARVSAVKARGPIGP